MRKNDDRGGGVNIEIKNSMVVPTRLANKTRVLEFVAISGFAVVVVDDINNLTLLKINSFFGSVIFKKR